MSAHESPESLPHLDAEPEALDPGVAAVLGLLFDDATGTGSLARLSKRAGLAMSALRRLLSAFEEAGWVVVADDDKGRAVAALTDAGRAFCVAVLPPAQRAAAATSRPTSFKADSISDDQA